MQAGREIKFQVWDQDAKLMWSWEDILQGVDHGVICFVEMLQQDQFVKRQFTGLRDKHGKEIYEGDVLLDRLGNYRLVEYADNFAAYRVRNHGEYLFLFGGTAEVIGNIYENPELLEVGK